MVQSAAYGDDGKRRFGGIIGLAALLPDPVVRHRVLAHIAGSTLRIPVAAPRDGMESSPAIEAVLVCYIRGFLIQVHQSVVWNSVHSMSQRCARWLLIRFGGDSFKMTQQGLAGMLRIRRPGVTRMSRRCRRRDSGSTYTEWYRASIAADPS